MGGALILVAIAGRARCCGRLANRFVWIVLGVTFAFGLIGFYDDYLKLVVEESAAASRRAGSISGSRSPGCATAAIALLHARTSRRRDRAVPAVLQERSRSRFGVGFIALAYS